MKNTGRPALSPNGTLVHDGQSGLVARVFSPCADTSGCPHSTPASPSGLPGAAGRAINLPGGKTSVRRCKLNVDRSKLCRLASASQGGLAAEFLQLLHGSASGNLQRRPDGARSNAVDPNTLWSELFGERLDIVHRRRFRLRVVVKVRGRIVGLFRRRADDDGPGLKVRQRRLDDPERGADVGLDRRVEILGRNIEDRTHAPVGARRC